MKIIGDRHYKGTNGEPITFSQVPGGIKVGQVLATPGGGLPVTVQAGTHQTVAVTVGFTGNSGGSVDIEVSGTGTTKDTSRVRQINGLSSRSAMFVVD